MSDAGSFPDAAAVLIRPEVRERTSVLPLLGWTTFVVLVLYAVLLGGSWLGIYSVGLRTLSLAITAIGLFVWLVFAWRRPEWRPSTAIWPAFVLPVAALALSALFSRFQRLGLEYVAWSILLTALYLLLVRVLALPYARARIGGLAAILGLVLGLSYIGWVFLLWIEWWGLVGSLQPPPLRPLYLGLTWGNPSAVLTIEVLLLVIAAAGLGLGTRGARITLTVLTVVTLIVVVMSGSRAGWLAIAGAAVAVGGLWVLHELWLRPAPTRLDLRRLVHDRRVRVGLAVVGAAAVVIAVVFAPGILARIQDGGDGGRFVYYTAALRMFVESPILGTGPGTWAARRPAYTEAGELDFVIPHAHNVYLHTAAELGVVGLGVGIVVFACVGWLLIHAIRGDDLVRRRWAWMATFGLVYLGFHSLFDYYANMPSVLLLVAIPIAVLDATATRRLPLPVMSDRVTRSLRRATHGALVIGCVLAVVTLARAEAVAFTHQRAVLAVNKADWGAALGPAAEAVRDDPGIAPYQQTLGLAAAGARDWQVAARAFRSAAEVDDLPASWLGLAFAQQQLGEPADAVAGSLTRALRLGSQQPAIAFAAAHVYDRVQMPTQANDAYLMALTGLPELAAADEWRGGPLERARFEELLSRAVASSGRGWEVALMAGELEQARAVVGEPAASGYLGLLIDAWGGDADAIREVQAIGDANVLDPWLLSWASRVTSHAGDREAAERYRRLIDVGLRGAPQGVEVRIGRRVAERDAALGTNAYNYGNYMHRRTSPFDLIVPGLPGPIIKDAPGEPGEPDLMDELVGPSAEG